MTATLVPIVKDKLGDVCSSKNYRSIAISSLVLKLIDWVIILQYGHLMKTNEFQSKVYGCLLDCSKAFDTVKHSKLFLKLKAAKIPSIIIRLLMTIYRKQTAKVKWEGSESEEFEIKNGVRQGAVISPLFFSFYLDDLFGLLKASGSGCYVGDYYAGCFGYADDLFFLCPSKKGLQEMLDIAQEYMSEHNITFSTNVDPVKSKT